MVAADDRGVITMLAARSRTATAPRERTIRDQLAVREEEREAVVAVLREAVLAAVDFGPRDIPSPTDREWLRDAIAICVDASIETELATIAHLLAEALEAAPDGLGNRFDRSHDADRYGVD